MPSDWKRRVRHFQQDRSGQLPVSWARGGGGRPPAAGPEVQAQLPLRPQLPHRHPRLAQRAQRRLLRLAPLPPGAAPLPPALAVVAAAFGGGGGGGAVAAVRPALPRTVAQRAGLRGSARHDGTVVATAVSATLMQREAWGAMIRCRVFRRVLLISEAELRAELADAP